MSAFLRHVLVVPFLLTAGLSSAQDYPEVLFEPIIEGLSFNSPVEIGFVAGEEGRLYIVEKGGTIRVWDDGTEAPTLFLDIQDRVSSAGFECGLLGLAFSPDYETSGEFYVNYTADGCGGGETRVSRFERSSTDPPEGDEDSEEILLTISQPFSNHNGGKIAFGPDGYLYISVGDGGSGGDPEGNGQNLSTHLGSLLRIDVTAEPDEGESYVIPPDNPFLENPDHPEAQPEIYAYGLRNSWKFSFDSETGALWLGDVGQITWEEIDIIEPGGNYGWAEMEGPECYPIGSECDPELYDLPVFSYGRTEGSTVTGGVMYRGTAISDLTGHYVFADFGSDRFWMLQEDGKGEYESVLLSMEVGNIVSINERPADKEIFVASLSGDVYQVVPANDTGGAGSPPTFLFEVAGPNPVGDATLVRVRPEEAEEIRLRLVDAAGRDVTTLFAGALASQEIREFELDMHDLSPGVYFVVLDHASGRKTQRVTVMH